MEIWLLFNSIGLAAVGFVLYLMLRQMGFVLKRVGPTGARATVDGPRIGEDLTQYLAALSPDNGSRQKIKLIVFGSDTCSICAHIKGAAYDLAKNWHADADIYLVYDCQKETDESAVSRLSKGMFFKRACNMRERVGATFVPFAVATDRNGLVTGKGLVNEIAHLESLLEQAKSKAIDVKSTAIERGAEA